MKIFETVIKNLVFLGVDPNESRRFNWKVMTCFLVFGLNIVFNGIFIFSIEDLTLTVYMEFVGIILALIEMSISLLAIVLQRMKLFALIGCIENVINESNSFKFDVVNEF